MATTTFSIRLDEDIKRRLDEFCDKIGISTNAAFSLFANKVVMENRIPFEIADTEAQYHKWILEQLKEREKHAADPNTKWYSHNEFWQMVEEL
jgi:DNA-damage-inducible protein J